MLSSLMTMLSPNFSRALCISLRRPVPFFLFVQRHHLICFRLLSARAAAMSADDSLALRFFLVRGIVYHND